MSMDALTDSHSRFLRGDQGREFLVVHHNQRIFIFITAHDVVVSYLSATLWTVPQVLQRRATLRMEIVDLLRWEKLP